MKDISALTSLSEDAYRSKDFGRAKLLLDEIIELAPESPEGLGSRHLRAMAYEFGNVPGGVDLMKSLADYRFLADRWQVVGSDGLVGSARVLCAADLPNSFNEVKKLCLLAVQGTGDVRAKMLLGYIYVEVAKDYRVAREWFLSAFKGGSPWGMKYFAATHLKDRNFVRGALFHAVSWVVWPVLSLSKKSRSPYY